MKSHEPLYCAVDIGTSVIKTLIAQKSPEGFKVAGFGIYPSAGIKKGQITDLKKTIQSAKLSYEQAHLQAGLRQIASYGLSIGAQSLQLTADRYAVAIRHRTVQQSDILNIEKRSFEKPLGSERQILHTLTRAYTIDQHPVDSPLGMRGIKLEAQVQHIHVDAHDLRTRLDLLSELGIQVQYIAADPLVTPIALLSSEQKDDGCIVIDCGAGTTKISIYTQNSLAWMTVLPVGSDHLTSDLAQALGISRSVAEVLKVRHGRCGNKCQKEMIQVPLLHEKRQQYFHQADLNWVLEMRLKEIFELCLKEIMSCPVPSASLGILLTGGGAQIPGIVALAQDVFHRPVSIGLTQVPATSPFFNNPSSATVVGLLQGMLESENRQQGRHHSLWPHWCQNILSWMAS